MTDNIYFDIIKIGKELLKNNTKVNNYQKFVDPRTNDEKIYKFECAINFVSCKKKKKKQNNSEYICTIERKIDL